jgi:hypothetical protein
MSETNQKGDIGEAAFYLAAMQKGYWAGQMPQHCPYDYVLDRGNGPERIQVKYRSLSNGSVHIKSYSNSSSSSRSYKDMVDFFAVYVPELKEVYLLPAELVNEGSGVVLRVEPSRNNQTKGIRFLADYLSW